MSLRLKNESTSFPPGGLIFHQRELGWKNTVNDPTTMWSWENLIASIQRVRSLNRSLFPGLSLDRETIRREISEQNARRIAGMAGAETYLREGGGPMPNPQSASSALSFLPAVATKLKDLANGAANLWEWWVKENGIPVPRERAEARGAVCVSCPKNNMEGEFAWFTAPAAALIKKKMEARSELKLETSHDDKLGVCEACHCQNALAVHEPLPLKLKHLSPEAFAKLWEKCWVHAEKTPTLNNENSTSGNDPHRD